MRRIVFLAVCLFLVSIFLFASGDCDKCVQTDDGFWGCQGGHASGWSFCLPESAGRGCALDIRCPSGPSWR